MTDGHTSQNNNLCKNLFERELISQTDAGDRTAQLHHVMRGTTLLVRFFPQFSHLFSGEGM